MKKQSVGVLAFQGGFVEHQRILESLGQKVVLVRSVEDLKEVSKLIIPGGESTTIGFFLEETGLGKLIQKRNKDKVKPLPLFGTCAGAIVLAKKVKSNIIPPHLGLLDIIIERNAYGTQFDSFYTELEISDLGIVNFKAAFIRAPIIKNVAHNVKILAKHQDDIVLVQQGNILAATFHPELRNEARLHEFFLTL